MYGISYLIEDTQHILDKFLNNIDLTQDILEEVVDERIPHVSPHKKQRYNILNIVKTQRNHSYSYHSL